MVDRKVASGLSGCHGPRFRQFSSLKNLARLQIWPVCKFSLLANLANFKI